MPAIMTYCWMQHHRYIYRHELKRHILSNMDRDSLILFNFTRTEYTNLKWEEEDEFEYHHRMYDVVHTQIQGDTLYLWCWEDQNETYLKTQLQQQLQHLLQGTFPGKTHATRLISFFKSLYVAEKNDWKFYTSTAAIIRSPETFVLFLSLSFPPHTPPPK